MIGLDDVIQILDLPVKQLFWAFAFGLQLRNRDTVGRRLVGVDDGWLLPILSAIQGLTEKSFRCLGVACRREIEVDRVPELVDGSVQIGSFAANLHIGLVDTPARGLRPAPVPAQALFDLWRIFLNPAIDRRMINRHAPFSHHLFKIAVAHTVAAIPAHRPQDHIALKMAPLKFVHQKTR